MAAELPGLPADDSRDWLALRAQASPDAAALFWRGERWGYADLDRQVELYAQWLYHLGVEPGDGLALLSPNSPAVVCLVHAAARAGALLIPLNQRLTTAELSRQLQAIPCRLLLYDPLVQAAAEAIEPESVKRLALPATPPEVAAAATVPPFQIRNQQAAIFTSGTSGAPKAALLTFENHFWSAVSSAFRTGCLPEDRWLACLPLCHVGGLAILFRSCLYGSAVILHAGFDLQEVKRSLDEDGVTVVSLVPTMLHRLLQTRSRWPASLRLALIGGAAATPELVDMALAAGAPVALTYGLTEAASQVATMPPAGVRARPGSVGKPLMFTRVRIVGPDGRDCSPGELGEVVVSGPTVMAGYAGQPEATQATLRAGELFTGDIGYLDDEGYLWLVQRRADLIISGGENVYPAEVEAVLRRCPGVDEACVVGLPDPEWGQMVAALVTLRAGRTLTTAELDEHCRRELAGYKRPRRLKIVAELPRTASGKPVREDVRQILQA